MKDKQYILDGFLNPAIVFTHTYTEDELQDVNFAQVSNSIYLVHQNHHPAQIVNGGSDLLWTLSDIPIVFRALTGFEFESTMVRFKIVSKNPDFSVGSTFTFITDGSGNVTSGPTLTGAGGGSMIGLQVEPQFDPGGTWTAVLVLDEGATVRQEWDVTVPGGFQVFSFTGNHPGSVALYEQRLIFGGSTFAPQQISMSKTGLENYQTFTLGPNDNDGIRITIAGTQYDRIRHMNAGPGGLLVFTTESEYTVLGGGGFAITPTNRLIRKNSNFGSTRPFPIQIGNEFIFISNNKYVRSTAVGATTSPEVSILSEHLVREGGGIVRVAYAKDPDNIYWMIRADGQLISMTIMREQAVISFAIHNSSTDLFKDVVVIPSATFDQVYFTIRRAIDGNTPTQSEVFDYDQTTNQVGKVCTDSSFYFNNAVAFTNISGLNFLEAEVIDIVTRKDSEALVGDEVEAQLTVTGNQITLPLPVNSAKLGIPIDVKITLMPPEVDDVATARSSAVRLQELFLILDRTLGAVVEFYDSNGVLVSFENISFLDAAAPTNIPLPVFTGQKKIRPGLGWESPYTIVIKQALPMPFTLLATIIELTINRP